MSSLSGKIALVTGAGRGIGEATAFALDKLGANIVVNDINEENARAVQSKLKNDSMINLDDVSQVECAKNLAAAIKDKFGKINIIVNNAGITRDSMLHKMTDAQWEDVIRINLKGPYNVVQACLSLFDDSEKYGRIINLSSVAYLGNVGQTNYSASKAGVVGMTRTWALELSKKGITSNAIAPGLIDSVLTQKIPDDIKAAFVEKIPLKRIGEPKNIADVIAFLASPEACYITGQTIHVDGGISVGF